MHTLSSGSRYVDPAQPYEMGRRKQGPLQLKLSSSLAERHSHGLLFASAVASGLREDRGGPSVLFER